jgi:hypothetical protein
MGVAAKQQVGSFDAIASRLQYRQIAQAAVEHNAPWPHAKLEA